MAPQNLNQVFVANATTTPALVAGAFSQAAASGLASNSKFGIWDVKGSAYLTGASSATSLMTTAGVLNTALTSVQFTQTMLSGNVIATPIIDIKDIKKIAVSKYEDSVRHKIVIDTGAPSAKDVMVRIALRTAPTAYANYYQDGTSVDLSGGGYEFPLLGNFSAGRMIFNIEVSAGEHSSTEATLYDQIVAKIADNRTLNALFTTTDNTTTMDIVARHAGVVFDITVQYSDKTILTPSAAQAITGFDAGSGKYWKVLSDEKSQRARYGNFNRMYFPLSFPTFAQSGTNYDAIDITYAHNHPAATGIARAGELNNVRIYVPTAVFGSTNVDTVFCNTDTNFQAALAVAAGVTEYYF